MLIPSKIQPMVNAIQCPHEYGVQASNNFHQKVISIKNVQAMVNAAGVTTINQQPPTIREPTTKQTNNQTIIYSDNPTINEQPTRQ